MAWKQGPLPANTWNWGGVVPVKHGSYGFFFADFYGDHVVVDGIGIIKAEDVAWYDNSIELPPNAPKGIRLK